MSPLFRPARGGGAVRLDRLEDHRGALRGAGRRRRRGCGSGIVPTETPSQARRTAPKRRIWPTTKRDGVRGDREADALGAADDRGVDADHLAARGRRAAPPELPGLSAASVWITSSIEAAGAAAQRAAEGGDDAGGHGRLEAERVADRDGDLARAQVRAVAERAAARPAASARSDGEVGVGVAAEHARLAPRGRRRSGRATSRAPATTWLVGDDEAVRRQHHAGAAAAAAARQARDRGADRLGHADDGLRIGVEQAGVGGSGPMAALPIFTPAPHGDARRVCRTCP